MKKKKKKAKTPINVVIVDDEESYRESLKQILEKDSRIRIFGEYNNGKDFIRSFESPFKPDVCLVDIVLDNLSGIDCIKKIKENNPDVYFIVMTAYPDVKTFAEVREIGADYMEKGTRIETLLDKIITSVNPSEKGNYSRLISLKSDGRLDFKYVELADRLEQCKRKIESLSATQLQVLKLKKRGKSIKEISEELHISEGTVHTHITRAMKKLDLPNLIDYIID